MAKRTPRSKANDMATAAPTEPKNRSRSRSNAIGAPAEPQEAPDTFAARPQPTEQPIDSLNRQPHEGERTPTDPGEDVLASEAGPSEEEIRLRAYQRYLERGGNHGMDFDDWLEAERDLKGRRG